MGAALACGRAQGEGRASPEVSVRSEPSNRNKKSLIPKAFCNEGSASPHTPQSTIGAGGQQHSASTDIERTELARTELATSASSGSSVSQCSGYRRSPGMMWSISSRDLNDGVQEWEQPHLWLEKGPPASPCEQERLDTLHAIAPEGKLENLHHPNFGPLLELACKIFRTESAAVSLMDKSEMYILEGRGRARAGDRLVDPRADSAFCCWSVIPSCASVLTVEDTLLDARFQSSKLVTGAKGIRFYIGAPLVASNGHRMGMMCVYDTKPRKVDANTAQIVCNLAELAVRELEKKWALQMEWNNVRSALRCLNCYEQGFIFLDLADAHGWQILYVSPQAVRQTGLPEEVPSSLKFWDLFECEFKDDDTVGNWKRAVQREEGFSILGVKRQRLPGQTVPEGVWDPEFRPVARETLSSSDCALIGIPADLPALISHQRLFVAELKRRINGPAPAASAASSPIILKGKKVVSKKDCGRPKNIPFAGCEVGQLISEDGQVRFYRGIYHGNPVILKVIDTSQLDINGGDDLVLTSRVTTRLRHPCVVRTMAHCVTAAPSSKPWDSAGSDPSRSRQQDACWMMLEYCDKGTLQDAILKGCFLEGKKPGAPPDIKAVVSAGLEIAMGMAYLHGRDLIHGDLNGDSVWLQSGCTPQGFHCKVSCFALSRNAILARLDAGSYAPISHFPPELLKDNIITKAADAYAFGILMWELYNCARAWANLTHGQVAKAVFMNRKLQWPASTPVKYRKLASACMAYDPEDRPMFSECVEQLHNMWAMYDRCGD